MAQGGKPVAVDRGAFEIERLGGFLHRLGDFGFHLAGTARKKGFGLRNQLGIVVLADFARAGPGTALDLEKEAGARAAFKHRIGAGTQEKGALQGIDCAPDGPRRGERAEIIALLRACAAMLEDAGRRMVAGQKDIGERLVVAQKDIEAWPQPLDEVRFQKQRFGFRSRNHEFHGRRLAHHAADTVCMAATLRVVGHALLEAARLAT